MARLIAWLQRYVDQPDKLLHFAGCFLIAITLQASGFGLVDTLWVCFGVAWCKERYDKAHPDRHTWDGWDAFATTLGALVAVTVWQAVAPSWRIG